MTLKEKFTLMVLDKDIADWEKSCEKIAEDFAIGFVVWFVVWILSNENKFVSIEYNTPEEAVKDLMEIYKKEKGL